MSYVKFHLDGLYNGKYSIRMRIRLNPGVYIRYYTGEKIERRHWSTTQNRVLKSHKEHYSINDYLDQIEVHFNAVRRGLHVSNKLTSSYMRIELDKYFRGLHTSFFDLYDSFITEKKIGLYSKDLSRKHKNIRDKIFSFNPGLSVNDLSLNFMVGFTNYLFSEKNLSTNTVSKYIKFFKSFIREIETREIIKPVPSSFMNYSIRQKETRHPYLSLSELEIIEKYKPKADYLINVKYELLKGAYSGLRHSDWDKLNLDNIVNIENRAYFQIMTTKTKEMVFIPATDKLKNALSKKSHHISNQKFNKYIKTLCAAAGINSVFIKPEYKGNKATQKVFKKHEIVSSHIARRSFVVNSLKASIPSYIIMKVTGHKNESSFKRYAQLSTVDGLEQFFM